MSDYLPAEQAVLGAAMLGKNGFAGVMALAPEDFFTPKHIPICIALQGMIRRGLVPDQLTLSDELAAQGKLDAVGGFLYLNDLAGSTAVAMNSMHYAVMVREAHRVRMVEAMGERLRATMGYEDAAANLDELLARHASAIESIPPALDGDADSDLPTIAELFDKTFSKRWVIEGMLGRRERVVLVAAEGLAKSVLSTQWAICLAAGLHPFTGESFGEPKRVLLIDAENDEEQSQHRYRWVGDRVNMLGGAPGWAKRIQHQIRVEGLDIVGKDRAWFTRVVAKASPDLIVMGPAYKMMGAAKTNDDAAILAFFAVLDEIRVKFDTALLIEAHTGHAKDENGDRAVRPFGSSVWQRWPEVGIGLRRSKEFDAGEGVATVLDVTHWRGSREQRDWPDTLKRGSDAELPWTPFRPDYWASVTRSAA